ncbi:MAG: cupin domain-containing protein [Lachnospiraceae bacterium]|jgi:mannose-6-phosphate isomerase-like protein (cupin superfamily)|nr:cupin domain-containing protein [Lachnospiraceae bacterium]
MIRKPEDFRTEQKEHMRGGDGTVILTHFITGPEELNGKGRLFSKITLNPGCSIGYHVHETDAELFYILRGTAEYNDAGVIRTVTAGDVTICPTGTGHGIANRSAEVVELVAVIVYA